MTITATPEQLAAGVVLGGLVMLSGLGANIAIILGVGKRKPSIDQTLQGYANKDDLDGLRTEISGRCVSQHGKLDNNVGRLFDLDRERAQRLADWQAGVAAQLGRIESSIADIREELKK